MIRVGSGLASPDDSDAHKQRSWDKANHGYVNSTVEIHIVKSMVDDIIILQFLLQKTV